MTDGTFGPGAADVHTLTGAYALGALDDAEIRAVEAHLVLCAECAQEVRSFRETAARLADGVRAVPPPALRARVLAEVRSTPQLPPLQRGAESEGAGADADTGDAADTGPGPAVGPGDDAYGRPAGRPTDEVGARRAARRRRTGPAGALVAAAVAAMLALGAGAFGVVQFRQASQERQARVEAAAQQQRVAEVLADPARRVVTGPVTGGGSLTVVVARGRAVVSTAGFSGLPADRAYQLWLVRADGTIDSAGLGPAAASGAGSWLRPVDGVRAGDRVAVSVEPTGGSQQPTTTPLVALEV